MPRGVRSRRRRPGSRAITRVCSKRRTPAARAARRRPSTYRPGSKVPPASSSTPQQRNAGRPRSRISPSSTKRTPAPREAPSSAARRSLSCCRGCTAREDVSARPVVAFDGVLLHHALGEADGGVGEADQRRGAPVTEEAQQRGQVLADGRRQMAGVAPAGASASKVGFEHDRFHACVAERQRRREARVARADDRHVGVELAPQRPRGLGRGIEVGAILAEGHDHALHGSILLRAGT